MEKDRVSFLTLALANKHIAKAIADLGDVFDWLGVTTTELADGSTTNPITINGESVTAKAGDVVQYNGVEFVYNGTEWQEFSERVTVENGCIIFG